MNIDGTDEWKLELLNARGQMGPREPSDGESPDNCAALMALAETTGGKCWYCGCALRPPGNPGDDATATRDHLIPRSRGGTLRKANLVPACRGCNNAKRARTVEEYRAALVETMGVPVTFYGERQ